MIDPDVARVIGQLTDNDDPVALTTLRRELAKAWPGDHDAEVLANVIDTKLARLRSSN